MPTAGSELGLEPPAGVDGRPRKILIRADGAARGNPGPAAAGAVLLDASRPGSTAADARPRAVIARPLGIQTNNYAEYMAVILALERARELGADEIELVLDSKLVVEQLAGRWRVRHPGLVGLHARAQQLLAGFRRWDARHEPRAANSAADALANLALDDPVAAATAEGGEPSRAAGGGSASAQEESWARVSVGAACVVLDDRRRVLLVRLGYAGREWALPGGSAHAGEAPDAAARRELREETGLGLSGGEFAAVYYDGGHPRKGSTIHFVYRFAWQPGLVPIPQPPEIEDVSFYPLDSLPEPMSDFTRRRIADAAAGKVVYGVVERSAG